MRKLFTLAILFCATAPVYGQQRLTLDIPGLSDRAKEEVNVTLDGPLLKLAAKFLSNDQPDEAAVRDIASKLEGIYVRSYTFEHEGEYDKAIVDHLRSQLTTWKRIVSVKEKFRETSDVYVDMKGENVVGLAIINAEPRELTIVNIVGSIDLDKLAKLEGQFGIPRMRRERSGD
jgi:hypothetical protein